MGKISKPLNRSKDKKNVMINIIIIALVFILSLLFIFPFWWLVSATMQPLKELMKLPPNLVPKIISFRSYITLDKLSGDNFNYYVFYLNSIIVASVTTVSQVLFASMSGYGFARYEFPGKNKIFMMLLAGMMVPAQVVVIPLYMFYAKLKIVNTIMALILPGLSSVFGTFLFRQTFVTIPKDMEESAYIDGATAVRTFFKIMLPEVKSTIVAFTIIAFNGSWNSYFMPLILTSKPKAMTLPVGITMLKNVYSTTDYSVLFAAIVLAILPIFIIFLFLQKYFVQGMSSYAIKG